MNTKQGNLGSDPRAIFTVEAILDSSSDADKGDKVQSEKRAVELGELAKQVAELFSSDAISPFMISGLVRLGEFVGLMSIALAVHFFYLTAPGETIAIYAAAAALGPALSVSFIQAFDGYQVSSLRSLLGQFSKAATGFTLAMVMLVIIGFFSKVSTEYSRVWFAAWYVLGMGFLLVYRGVVSAYVKRAVANGRLERRAVIVGGGTPAAELIRSLEAQSDSDIRVCGIFDDRGGDRSPAVVAGYPKLGTVPELVEFARRVRIDMLIVALPLSAEQRLLQLLKRLWVLPVDIRLSAHANKLRFRPRSYTYEGTVPFLDLFDKPIANWDAIIKRTFDIFFATIALIALSPLMVATAIAIKLESKGPVLFRQKRYGFNNELIEIYKFRSMYTEMSDAKAERLVSKDDPRVTRVGRFIRKTSIDELPQLFNVLKNQLSLVGPRPHAVSAKADERLYDEVVDGYFARHKVKPGITGWAQINGWRGETDTREKIEKRVECDLYYIENWSLLLDLYILFATPLKLLNTENAY